MSVAGSLMFWPVPPLVPGSPRSSLLMDRSSVALARPDRADDHEPFAKAHGHGHVVQRLQGASSVLWRISTIGLATGMDWSGVGLVSGIVASLASMITHALGEEGVMTR